MKMSIHLSGEWARSGRIYKIQHLLSVSQYQRNRMKKLQRAISQKSKLSLKWSNDHMAFVGQQRCTPLQFKFYAVIQ